MGGKKKELGEVELQMIEQWVRLAGTMGIPRSFAQIYGLCFVSKIPVNAQDCVDKLKISRSSAGQGLRALREVGAIRSTFRLGSRVESFTIEPDLGVVVRSLLDGKVVPAFDEFFAGMTEIHSAIETHDDRGFLSKRIGKVERWGGKLKGVRKWLLR